MEISTKTARRIEVATNLAVLLAALTFVATVGWNFLHRERAATLQSGLSRGEVFPRLPGVDYSNSRKTVVVALNTGCHFCRESIPFYQQLVKLRQGAPESTVQLAALFPQGDAAAKVYMERNRLDFDAVVESNPGELNIAGTPTIVLVDSAGNILNFWVGRLTPEAEREVADALRG